MNANYVFIGLPTSGKTTIGKQFSEQIQYEFLDTDEMIVNQEKCSLDGIIQAKGIDRFLDIEAEVCRSVNVDRTVISTGGSVIYRDYAMQHLKDEGIIIYLEIGLDTLQQRLKDAKSRGVAINNHQTLKDLFSERVPLYKKYADFVIPESESIEDSISKLIKMHNQVCSE